MQAEHLLAQDDFWVAPLHKAPYLLDELLEGPRPRARLWAPGIVALDQRRSLPVYVGVLGPTVELERLSFVERAIVVGVDCATGRTRAVRAGRSAGHEARERIGPPPGFEGGIGPGSRALAAQVTRCVLWDTSASTPPWPTGRYRLTLLAADFASDDVLVDVVRSMTTVDPAVREIARATGSLDSATAPAAAPLEHASAAGWPGVPAKPGVSLEIERVVTHHGSLVCRGAVRAWRPDGDVPVTLVITGSESPGPFVVPIRVPAPRDAAAGTGEVIAHFSVDLLRSAPLAATPQTYFVHAFTADGRTGPHPVAIGPA